MTITSAKLLQKHLPGVKLTGRVGLSNLLAWMGTGQGNNTELFLRHTVASGGFYSTTKENLVRKFEAVLTHNALLLADQRSSSIKHVKAKSIPGYIPLDDIRIWGQPANLLSATPTLPNNEKCTLEDKFSPYFSDFVQDSWMELLGDLVGLDPAEYTGNLPCWRDGMDLMAKLTLQGFMSGLTVFQLVNNLVFLGILSMPTENDIADWIFENPTLGANRGLIQLGFVLTDCTSVRCAFGCVYGHLERYLTDDDKQLLGFSTIFVEHVLCKVVRWNNRLSCEMEPSSSLDKIAKQLSCVYDWESGQNQTDASAFPFPFEASLEDIDQIIKQICVSSIFFKTLAR